MTPFTVRQVNKEGESVPSEASEVAGRGSGVARRNQSTILLHARLANITTVQTLRRWKKSFHGVSP